MPEPGGRWLRAWAWLTACAVLPLVTLGAEVTTRKVGMVDEVGFRAPWHLFEVSLKEKGLGFLIEHSHRLAGFVVGTCSIVLAVGLLLYPRYRPIRWLGVTALAGVVLQGVLGILRVNKNADFGPTMALVHGCFGQLVFCLIVATATLTSWDWSEEGRFRETPLNERRVRWGAAVLALLVFGQLIFGALLRHRPSPEAQRHHLLMAFVVVIAAVWLATTVWTLPASPRLGRVMKVLVVLVGVQLVLGVEAWLTRFSGQYVKMPDGAILTRDLFRTFHVLTGALILAMTVVCSLEAQRSWLLKPRTNPTPLRELEGVV